MLLSSRIPPLCGGECRKRSAYSQLPNNHVLLVIPGSNGVHTALSALPVPSLERGNRSTLRPDCGGPRWLLRPLCPVELRHERVDDDPQKCLLHAERTNGP